MNWNSFIKPFRESKIFNNAAEKILIDFFAKAGNAIAPSAETARSWLYSKRNCKVNTYFPNGKAESKQLFDYFRKRPNGKLRQLQQIFYNQMSPDSDSPIDTETTDLDVFCWSLVNQFLDLLGFQRVDTTISSAQSDDKLVNLPCEKSCLYCKYWKGDKSTVGVHRMPTQGTCIVHRENKINLYRRLSSSAVCERYRADEALISNMERVGYNVEKLI